MIFSIITNLEAYKTPAALTKTISEPFPAKKKTARKMMKGKTEVAIQQDAQTQEKVRRIPREGFFGLAVDVSLQISFERLPLIGSLLSPGSGYH